MISFINIIFFATEIWLSTLLYKSVKQFAIEKGKYVSTGLQTPSTPYLPLSCFEDGMCTNSSSICQTTYSTPPTDDPLILKETELIPGRVIRYPHGCFTYEPVWLEGDSWVIVAWRIFMIKDNQAWFVNGSDAGGRVYWDGDKYKV